MNLSPDEIALIHEKMNAYTQKLVCPVYGMYTSDQGKALGTGLCVYYQGHHVILTAFRNFLLSCLRNDKNELLYSEGLAYSLPDSQRIQLMQGKFLGLKAPLNIGAFSVEPFADPANALQLDTLENLAQPVDKDEVVFFQGFSGAIAESENFHRTQRFNGLYALKAPDFPGYHPDLHLGIALDSAKIKQDIGSAAFYPYIEGLRGAPVWGVQFSKVSDWRAEEAHFLGLIQNWDDQNQVLIVTRENVVAGFLGSAEFSF